MYTQINNFHFHLLEEHPDAGYYSNGMSFSCCQLTKMSYSVNMSFAVNIDLPEHNTFPSATCNTTFPSPTTHHQNYIDMKYFRFTTENDKNVTSFQCFPLKFSFRVKRDRREIIFLKVITYCCIYTLRAILSVSIFIT